MDTSLQPTSSGTASTRPLRRDAVDRLRNVLRWNAAMSAATGLFLALAPGAVDGLLDTGQQTWIRVVGISLVVFGADLALLARAPRGRLQRFAPWVCAADAAWVLGSAVTILLGWFSTTGVATVAVVAALVGAFAVLQFRAWRAMTR